MTHEERMNDPEYALTRVTDYLVGEVSKVYTTGYEWCKCLKHAQRIYDVTDAAVIIMARRADMALERMLLRKEEAL